MKSLTSAAIVALTAAVIGAGGLATSAYAQQGPQGGPNQQQLQGPGGPGGNQFRPFNRGQMQDDRGGPRRMGGLLDLVCSERGAERLEVAFVRLSHRIEITAEQQPLFDALKADALTAQTQFSDTCASVRPQVAEGQQPAAVNPVDRMQDRIAIEKAHTAALEAVLPSFEAFFNSLTDEQKAQLQPQRGPGGDGKGKGPRPHSGELPAQPGLPGQPAGDVEAEPAIFG
jgi:hypothetical protein